jgi:hypothetical protein
MHQPFACTVRLGMAGAADGDAYVAPEGFFLADGSPLITVDLAKDGRRAHVRPAIEIALLLEAAYGECPDAASLLKGLEAIVRALDAGDLARAAIAAVHLGLPSIIDPAAPQRLAAADRLLKGEFNPNEPRDDRGRWTAGLGWQDSRSARGSGGGDQGYVTLLSDDRPEDESYEIRRKLHLTTPAEDEEHGHPSALQISPQIANEFGGGGAIPRPSPKSTGPATGGAAAPYREGSFSISDWSGYPEGVPRPDGPFEILEGSDYSEARRSADNANRNLHRADQSLEGQHFHEIHPIVFGGDPVDPANKIPMAPSEHHAITSWWRAFQRWLQ